MAFFSFFNARQQEARPTYWCIISLPDATQLIYKEIDPIEGTEEAAILKEEAGFNYCTLLGGIDVMLRDMPPQYQLCYCYNVQISNKTSQIKLEILQIDCKIFV